MRPSADRIRVLHGGREWHALQLFLNAEDGQLSAHDLRIGLVAQMAETSVGNVKSVQSRLSVSGFIRLVSDKPRVWAVTDLGRQVFAAAIPPVVVNERRAIQAASLLRRCQREIAAESDGQLVHGRVVMRILREAGIRFKSPVCHSRAHDESRDAYLERIDHTQVRALEKAIEQQNAEWRVSQRLNKRLGAIAEAQERIEARYLERMASYKETANKILLRRLGLGPKVGRPRKHPDQCLPTGPAPGTLPRPKPMSKPAEVTAKALAWSSPWNLGQA